MTAVTAGLGRFVKRDAAGNVVTGTESRGYRLADLDNTAAPRVVLNDPASATPDDLLANYAVKIDGRMDEVLELQINADTADTADTGDSDVLLSVKSAVMVGGKWKMTEKALRLADRITPAGGAGIIDARGLSDDMAYAASAWAPYLRFAPGPNEVWILSGHQRFDVHDDTP